MTKRLLLLIDDNALLTGLYEAAFEKEGYAVVFAHDAETGLAIAREKKPDGIVLDLLMPGVDGFEVLEKLKKDKATKNIKIVVLTSVTKQSDLDRAKRLGALECLVKSELRLEEIIERVQAHF